MRRFLLRSMLVSLVGLVVLWPTAAQAAPTKPLWATINICDSKAGNTTVGIRASMPGNGTRQRMYMRFSVDWFDSEKRRYVPTGSRSRWILAGSARFISQQAGYNFGFEYPPAGKRFRFRGRVAFQWRAFRPAKKGVRRARWVVVKRASRITRGGLKGVRGGKPKGRSDAVCVVTTPLA